MPDGSGTVTLTPDDLGAATAEEVSQLKDDKLDKTGTAADSDKLGGQLPEHYANAQSVNQLNTDVAAITPDDTVVDGKPWTSKKTVDSLCMPLKATGNPVQVYPVEGYPLGVKVSWEPTQEGEGDPSPDNIRPITGRDAVRVTRCGKNLLCPETRTQDVAGIKWTGSKDGSFRIEGSLATGETAASFILSKETKDNIYAAIKSGINLSVSGIPTGVGTAVYDANWVGTSGATLKFPSGMGYPENTYFEVRNSSHTFDGTYYPQIELGSTATSYEPYTGSTTDIALPETVYGGTLDVETGVVTVEKKLCTLTGNESFAAYTYTNGFYFVKGDAEPIVNNSTKTKYECSHLPSKPFYNRSYFGGAEDAFAQEGGNTRNVAFRKSGIAKGDTASFVAWIKEQYDAGTPVQFWYKLAKPYTIQLSSQQIAALSGVNTLYTDAGTLTVTGREDPRHTIVELKNAIISLGGNI